MSIQRTHKQSDLEKRLKLLELQLHGKKDSKSSAISYQISDKKQVVILGKNEVRTPESNRTINYSDVNYLKKDLSKILILSTIAVAAEFLIYFSSRNNLLRIFLKI